MKRLCIAVALLLTMLPVRAQAQDLASIVAKARDQVESGNYQDAIRILGLLRSKTLPPQLATEAGLLETASLLVVSGPAQATTACGKAVIAADFDPEIARTQSPKIREVCNAAAEQVRASRLAGDNVKLGKLEAKAPEVAYQPVRVSVQVDKPPSYLKLVARVESSELEGSYDVPLIPSKDGPHLGTLDASWMRPGSKVTITLVPQDKHGDLGTGDSKRALSVPNAESAIGLGKVPEGAKVELDGDLVKPDEAGRVLTTTGKHEISLTLASGSYAETSVELKRGVVTRVALVPTQQDPSRAGAWIATGTAVALVVAGGALLINSEARRSELEDAAAEREPGTDLPANDYAALESIEEERALFQNIGIGLMAGGGGVAILATVLWFVPGNGSAETATGAKVTPYVGLGELGLRGSF